ncbi:MAG: hypothetical protein JWM63_3316 [Gammaproteobacteria bacterium]|nr:hypothetical protein [Gammaproteobacteria bacterium]
MKRFISVEELSALSLGAAILGTGGGGDPYLGRLAAQREIERHGAPELIQVHDLPDDALVVPIAMGGAPAIGLEKLLSEPFAETPVRRLESYLGRKVDAVAPLEIGGVNALIPIMAASRLGIPVVDGDSMGRAFPTLDNTTFNILGLSASPVVVTNEHGDAVIVDVKQNHRAELLSRAAITGLGGATCSTLYPMSGADAKRALLPNTLSFALAVGRAVERARDSGTDPFDALGAALRTFDPTLHVRLLFAGTVVDVGRTIAGGFNTGHARLRGSDDWTGETELTFQNEYLRMTRNGRLLAIVPDLICCLDSDTADAATCETLRYGQRLKVFGISCAPIMRTSAGLNACGPKAFGFHDAYVPIEAIPDEGLL